MDDLKVNRFLIIEEMELASILYDTENTAFPFVLIDNRLLHRWGLPETTKDLMDYQTYLFSSKELLLNFLECKGEYKNGLRN